MSKRKTILEIIEEFNNIHGDKYDYSLITDDVYKNTSSKLPIICNEHGIFYQDRKHHIRGHGCPKCAKTGIKYTNDDYIKKASSIHPNLIFDKCNYINAHIPIIVGCNKHGYFNIRPYLLFQNHSCPKCGHNSLTLYDFIKCAKKVHGDKYDYSNVNYEKAKKKVKIICPIHGDFYQKPIEHLNGIGCPYCNESKLEKMVNLNFPFLEREKTFDWLIYKKHLYLDFYDDKNKIAIECQGVQHFNTSFDFFTDKKLIHKRDKIKYNLCKEHNIKIIYYFPKDFLKYNFKFYNDKICCYTIDDLKKIIG